MAEHSSSKRAKTDQKINTVKIPPHSIEAEQSVLGSIMLDNQAWDKIADRITEQDFYRPDHRLIFNTMAGLVNRENPLDVLTISEILKEKDALATAGGEVYLFELANNTPSAANVTAYADIVRERSILRQLIEVAQEIADRAFKPEGKDSVELLNEAEQKVFSIAEQKKRGNGAKNIKSLLADAVDRIDTLFHSDDDITGIPTGYHDLDQMTSGLQSDDLIIIAGRPSMGKTSLAINIAEHTAIKSKKPVLIFSMEMSGESLAMRMLSSLGRIDQHKIRTGKLEEEDWPRITSTVGMLSEASLHIDDTPALSPSELRSRARRVAREHGQLGLIVIDYLQLMQVPGTRENRTTEISEISRNLKTLAKELHVPVIALSQLNRSLEQRTDKRPVMSDLRECVTGDTLVMLSDGRRVPIKELEGEKPEIISVTKQGKLIHTKADNIWKIGKREIFKIHLASGRSLTATADHKVLTISGWREIQNLSADDRLAIAHHLPEPTRQEKWTEAKLALLGQLIGDGSYLTGQPLRYTTSSEENSKLVTEAATIEFGATVKAYKGRGNWHQLLISGNGNRWHPAGVNKWLRELNIYGQRSFEKRIPETIFKLSNDQVAILLRHLWATDGTIYTRKPDQHGAHLIHFSTNSKLLAFDVSALLLRFSIVTRIKITQTKNYRPVYIVCILGAEMQNLFLKQIGAFGPKIIQAQILEQALKGVIPNTNTDTIPQEIFTYVRTKMQELGISHRNMAAARGTAYGGTSHFNFSPSRQTLQTYAEILNDNYLKTVCASDLYWDRITKIEPCGIEEVYDITVPTTSSWLADGIVSHNSGAIEQDADLIMFIYRDEVYNENSPEKGKAEIIIAKQRNGPIGKIPLTFLGNYTRFENYIENI